MDEKKYNWPAWFYGPDGANGVFKSPEEVPEGWHDHPSKVGQRNAKTAVPEADSEASPGSQQIDGAVRTPDGSAAANKANEDEDSKLPDDLPAYDEVTASEIGELLELMEIEFNSSWDKKRLYELLEENWED